MWQGLEMSAVGSLRAGTPLRGYPSHCVGPFREAADGYTVPKAPAGYALINVIDIVSRNMKIISMDLLIVPQVMDQHICWFRINVLSHTN